MEKLNVAPSIHPAYEWPHDFQLAAKCLSKTVKIRTKKRELERSVCDWKGEDWRRERERGWKETIQLAGWLALFYFKTKNQFQYAISIGVHHPSIPPFKKSIMKSCIAIREREGNVGRGRLVRVRIKRQSSSNETFWVWEATSSELNQANKTRLAQFANVLSNVTCHSNHNIKYNC